MSHNTDFSADQLEQLDRIEEAVANLLEVLLVKPEYLRDAYEAVDREVVEQFHHLEIADIVAQHLSSDNRTVYFPIHVERYLFSSGEQLADFVSDTYV